VRTTKISIAIDKEQLRIARRAAKSEGMSLSGYIARALGTQLEDQARIDSARELYRSWSPETLPTAADREAFLERMSRPWTGPKHARKRRRANAA
jgi:hypothetical protein